jgi:hypothetical protein
MDMDESQSAMIGDSDTFQSFSAAVSKELAQSIAWISRVIGLDGGRTLLPSQTVGAGHEMA